VCRACARLQDVRSLLARLCSLREVGIVGKINSLLPNHRFAIAWHSPFRFFKTARMPFREKGTKACPGVTTGHFLRSDLEGGSRGIAGISSDSRPKAGGFLMLLKLLTEGR
jgi:hypothetical protein